MLQLRIGREKTPVASLDEARALYAAKRDQSGEGASSWPPGIVTTNGRKSHRISYNGSISEEK